MLHIGQTAADNFILKFVVSLTLKNTCDPPGLSAGLFVFHAAALPKGRTQKENDEPCD